MEVKSLKDDGGTIKRIQFKTPTRFVMVTEEDLVVGEF